MMGNFVEVLNFNRLFLKLYQFMCRFSPSIGVNGCFCIFTILRGPLKVSVLPQKSDIELWVSPEDVELVIDATIHTKYGLWCKTLKLRLIHPLNYSWWNFPQSARTITGSWWLESLWMMDYGTQGESSSTTVVEVAWAQLTGDKKLICTGFVAGRCISKSSTSISCNAPTLCFIPTSIQLPWIFPMLSWSSLVGEQEQHLEEVWRHLFGCSHQFRATWDAVVRQTFVALNSTVVMLIPRKQYYWLGNSLEARIRISFLLFWSWTATLAAKISMSFHRPGQGFNPSGLDCTVNHAALGADIPIGFNACLPSERLSCSYIYHVLHTSECDWYAHIFSLCLFAECKLRSSSWVSTCDICGVVGLLVCWMEVRRKNHHKSEWDKLGDKLSEWGEQCQ